MSTHHSGEVEGPLPPKQVEAILQECEDLTSSLARARTVRTLLLVALVAFVVITVMMFYRLGQRLQSAENLERLRAEAARRLEANSDDYMREVRLLVENATPHIKDAFLKQAKDDMPSYLDAINKEREVFARNLQERVRLKLEDRYHQSLARKIAILEEELPAARDEQIRARIMANMEKAIEGLIRKYYIDEMSNQINTLYDRWDRFPAADVPGPNDTRLEEQFIGALMELLSHVTTHPDAVESPVR